MIYSSHTNTCPETLDGEHVWHTVGEYRYCGQCEAEPPEHPANPILVALRLYAAHSGELRAEAGAMLTALDTGTLTWGADPAEQQHAIRVLTRLVQWHMTPWELDPKPFVAWGVRYPIQLGSAYFEPGPGYEQDRSRYPN